MAAHDLPGSLGTCYYVCTTCQLRLSSLRTCLAYLGKGHKIGQQWRPNSHTVLMAAVRGERALPDL